MRVVLPVEPMGEAPVQDAPETEGGPEVEAGATVMLQGLDVIVVEDDQEAREMMLLVLADRGANVRVAGDYESAVRLLEQAWPDVLVSDIGLPGRDGYELVRQVRQLQQARSARHLPAIALTAFARPEDQRKTLAAGFDLHLGKPLKPHMLLAAIGQCCRPAGGT
jgi:CheY-like chemotaxis protein